MKDTPCALPLAVTIGLTPGALFAEAYTGFKAQHYAEENGRIEVNSLYNRVEGRLWERWLVSAETVYNTISGATPTGLLPEAGSNESPTEEIADIRRAVSLNVALEAEDWNYGFSVNRGKEDDYSSGGAAFNLSRNFNKKNTLVGFGYAYTSDQIFPFSTTEKKKTHDAILSFSQILGKRTTFAVNLAVSKARGFLNDPYKSIQQTVEVLPGFFFDDIYKENRPNERTRWILYSQLNHRFEPLSGTIEASYRFSSDDWDVDTHTLGLAWFQDLGDALILQLSARYLRQSAADFYMTSLTGVDFDPSNIEPGKGIGPYYAPDHRLSEMATLNLGIKLRYEVTNTIAFDLSYERYTTNGLDDFTPDSVYSKANIFTLGGHLDF